MGSDISEEMDEMDAFSIFSSDSSMWRAKKSPTSLRECVISISDHLSVLARARNTVGALGDHTW